MGNIGEKALFLSETHVERPMIKCKLICALFVLEEGEGETLLHTLAQPLAHGFLVVLPTDLPLGLPLLRGIEHQIDLFPRATLPNRPPYRCNPPKTNELQRQV